MKVQPRKEFELKASLDDDGDIRITSYVDGEYDDKSWIVLRSMPEEVKQRIIDRLNED